MKGVVVAGGASIAGLSGARVQAAAKSNGTAPPGRIACDRWTSSITSSAAPRAFGLPDGEHRDYDSVTDLYLLPFAKNARRWRLL
jgi:hypothetical protein